MHPKFFFLVVNFYFIYRLLTEYSFSSQESVGVFSRESGLLLLGLSLSVATQSVRQYKTILVPIPVLSRRLEKNIAFKDTFFKF